MATTMSAGEQLDDITRRMDAAYAERARYPVNTSNWVVADLALEAVYADLRAWNAGRP